jgi:hypothetical protein
MYRDPRNSHQFPCPNDLCLDVGPTHNLTDVRGFPLRPSRDLYLFNLDMHGLDYYSPTLLGQSQCPKCRIQNL